jgi:hypothetical protein
MTVVSSRSPRVASRGLFFRKREKGRPLSGSDRNSNKGRASVRALLQRSARLLIVSSADNVEGCHANASLGWGGAFNQHNGLTAGPHWDAARRKFYVDGVLVKRFRQGAACQERILSAFQEEGWPPSIEDPLPPDGEQDPKCRLQNVIGNLNRHQRNKRVHFEGNGTGECVLWTRICETAPPRRRKPCRRRSAGSALRGVPRRKSR